MFEFQPGEMPAHGTIFERDNPIGDTRIDDRLGPNDAAGPTRAIHHDGRCFVRREIAHPIGQLTPGHADAAGNVHVSIFGESS